jgi:uncharacterized protein (DUF1697 family)
MSRHVAFLRAINVGGHTVKMERLRALFEDLGLKNVETFIASGNVLFDAAVKTTAPTERRIEKHLALALGYDVVTFVRSLGDLDGILSSHPFADAEPDAHALYVGFLKGPPDAVNAKKLLSLQTPSDAFHFGGNEVYWLCRTRVSDSKFAGPLLEKTLGAPVSFRNVTTVRKLAAKALHRPSAPQQP